jgi:CubicO group peptidase (beta-lactamase class C family)
MIYIQSVLQIYPMGRVGWYMEKVMAVHGGRVDTAPEQVGLDGGRLALLEQHFAELVEAGKLQGASYLVARDGQIVMHKSLGRLTHHEKSEDLLPTSPRKVYSITKMFTAIAIMQLIEQGKLYVHQPVSALIPEFDNAQHSGITIWHLLTHTSGLMGDPGSNNESYQLPWYEWWAFESKKKASTWETKDWLRIVLSGRTVCKPGEQWNYCSAGFAVLGEIIARASGISFEAYVMERIVKPLGMERSFFHVPDHLKKETCYVGDWGEKEIFDARDRTGMPPLASNGLFSTVEDLWKFGQAIMNKGTFNGTEILSRRSAVALVNNQLKDVRSNAWGTKVIDFPMALGLSLNDQDICTPGTYSHEGFGHCGLYIDPKERLIFSYLVPSKDGFVAQAVINPRAIVWSALI